MLFVYGDDSADEKKERVIAVGVIVGPSDAWEALEPKWIARNQGIPFHARDCESDQGDYRGLAHQDNKRLYRDLVTLLAESGLGGVGMAIDLVAQNKVFPDAPDLAYYKAFAEVLEKIKSMAVMFGAITEFTFDIGPENEYNAEFLYKMFRENDPDMLRYFHPKISFAPAREYPRLQAGDLMAFEAMKALDNEVGPTKRTRKSWEVLRNTGIFATWSFGEEWFSGLKLNLGELEKRVKFNQGDYINWLKTTNRQDNLSNLFHFSSLMAKRNKQ